MQITVTFRHMDATDALRQHAEKRLTRIAKYVHRPIDAHVILSVVKRRHVAEIILNADRATLNAKEETDNLYSAIDLAAEKVEQRARKHTAKLKSHKLPPAARRPPTEAAAVAPTSKRNGKGLQLGVIRADSVGRRKGPKVIRTERVPVEPMSVEEAIVQMDLTSNDFWIFNNAATDLVSVVYRRKDGNFGLIEPAAP